MHLHSTVPVAWQLADARKKSRVGEQLTFLRSGHRMEWKTIFPYSVLAIFFHSVLKIFHSILKFLPYSISYFHTNGGFRPETKFSLYCTLAAISVSLGVVALKDKMHSLCLYNFAKVKITHWAASDLKGGESSSQFRRFTIAKIEL